jgi:ATP-dependent RNA helicase DBP3
MMPAFMHIKARRETEGPRSGAGATGKGNAGPVVLVLAPTRELAMQTSAVATEVGAACDIQSCCIYGGVPKEQQRRELKTADVVIATPGRLLDLLEEQALKLSNVTYLVLDEADRMLDMGFEKDIRAILSNLRGHADGRQTLMFSATWPPAIQAIAAEFLHHPVQVTIGSTELAASASVTQICEVVEDPFARDPILLKLLAKYHSTRKNRVLVFVLYKKEAARMESYLQSRGWNCCAIHGDMSQEARTRSFNAFREGKIPLLIATDVAARGLDIPNVEYVINFSFPLTIEDYVHRIGRTGRGGKTGIAHTLFTPLDKAHAGELVNVLREAGAEVPSELLKFGTHVKKKEHSMYGAHFSAAAPSGGSAAPAKAHMKFDA